MKWIQLFLLSNSSKCYILFNKKCIALMKIIFSPILYKYFFHHFLFSSRNFAKVNEYSILVHTFLTQHAQDSPSDIHKFIYYKHTVHTACHFFFRFPPCLVLYVYCAISIAPMHAMTVRCTKCTFCCIRNAEDSVKYGE